MTYLPDYLVFINNLMLNIFPKIEEEPFLSGVISLRTDIVYYVHLSNIQLNGFPPLFSLIIHLHQFIKIVFLFLLQ